MFDGTTETFECVTRPDTVTVIPFLDPETVLLTKHIQPHREPFLDFPGGRIDKGKNLEKNRPLADSVAAARRDVPEPAILAMRLDQEARERLHA